MRTFLEDVAEKIYKTHPDLGKVTVVFPNRRASLYFKKYLSTMLSRPVFSPKILTIEDFFAEFSPLKVPDKLVLIARLFSAYKRVMDTIPDEVDSDSIDRFEDFYFWGEMLIRDFDEVDKYMIPASQLFKDLSHQKELDASFDFLTEEQREFLKDFWSNFDTDQSVNKRRFLRMWRRLFLVYDQFRKDLFTEGLAYEGMLHRHVAESLVDKNSVRINSDRTIVFAGFNALTATEEVLITFFVEHFSAKIFWDLDAWYVNNEVQEAGWFFREYQKKPILGKTFDQDIPANFQNKISSGRGVRIYGASQPVGQAKLMSQILAEEVGRGLNPEETLVVLADEKLLMPVLHGVSGTVEKLNVTMGFPLTGTPMYNFLEHIIEAHINRKEDHFNHRQVLALLGHPYLVAADAPAASAKRKEILKNNWVHIPANFLATEVQLHRVVFGKPGAATSSTTTFLHYLRDIVQEVGTLKSVSDLDKEYALQFLKFFNILDSVITDGLGAQGGSGSEVHRVRSFLRLFRQLVRSQRIPFSGEPLRGLQIMGVLETRNLDFKNVFILSLNEGAFPSTGNKGSYIPHNIRKAYGLPTFAHQDAIYSYLFYRSIQRAENVFLFYNTETDVLGQGEMSRYLQQLIYESGLKIEKRVLHNRILPGSLKPIEISKNKEIMRTLVSLNEGNQRFRGISPSALNSYIECRLQFYFRHVAKIKEADAVEEELDARVLGTFLHDVMENFYRQLAAARGTFDVVKEDFRNAGKKLDLLIDDVFRRAYRLDPDRPVEYAGQRLVVREIVKRFAEQIIRMDETYAPFTIEALEQGDITYPLKIDREPREVILSGKIDRVDRKGETLRIIDYKTGRDELDFENVDSLFARNGWRNKAAFQTLLYALMYTHAIPDDVRPRIVPGLINRMNVFDEGFEFGLTIGKQPVNDVTSLLPEFERNLKALFEEMYDEKQPFDQTTNLDVCKFCAYSSICYR